MEFLDKQTYAAKKDDLIHSLIENNANGKATTAAIMLFHATTRRKGLWNRISAYGEEIYMAYLFGTMIFVLATFVLYIYSIIASFFG